MNTDTQDLTVRSPSELLEMSFPASDNYVADGVIAKGQRAAMIGPAGIGKSMTITQLAYSCILGTPFLDLPVGCEDKNILILQAENSNRRLASQLTRQLSGFTDDEKRRIDEHLSIHTLEQSQDSALRMKGGNANAVARLLSKTKPDIVFIDPLNAFAQKNLNTDDGMLDTLHELELLAKEANPDVAIIIVHHTRTDGRAYLDAVGPSRSNYGRGSKALHGWSRGTFNIAAGSPDDSSKILVACGKNSNGPDFEPFGAVRNPETLLFERDPSFRLDVWKQEMSGKPAGRLLLTPEQVAGFVADRPLNRQDLLEVIMEESGCAKSKAYQAIKDAQTQTIVRGADRLFRSIKV
ncbi:AAA family ATPase [Prosthecobacter sp.]|uniref:AAA family ATPase n=1 Tax=Prosthecobacter sp. TaxID=1965333 RepID=UPI0037840D77